MSLHLVAREDARRRWIQETQAEVDRRVEKWKKHQAAWALTVKVAEWAGWSLVLAAVLGIVGAAGWLLLREVL